MTSDEFKHHAEHCRGLVVSVSATTGYLKVCGHAAAHVGWRESRLIKRAFRQLQRLKAMESLPPLPAVDSESGSFTVFYDGRKASGGS